MKPPHISLLAAGLAAVLTCSVTAQCWHVARDFRSATNPIGDWTFGWSGGPVPQLAPPTGFSAYQQKQTMVGGRLALHHAMSVGRPFLPAVFSNLTTSPVPWTTCCGLTFPPRAMVLHPGASNEHSIVRWTSPRDAVYDIDAVFTPIDTGFSSADVHVVVNGIPFWTRLLDTPQQKTRFVGLLPLRAGDFIDFSAGFGLGSLLDDAIRLDVQVYEASPGSGWACVPRPTAGGLGDPSLRGAGALMGGGATSLTLEFANPLAPTILILGASRLDVPLFGGLLVPFPGASLPLAVDASGRSTVPITWPSGVPSGTDVWFQAWIFDVAAPQAFASSNGLRARTP